VQLTRKVVTDNFLGFLIHHHESFFFTRERRNPTRRPTRLFKIHVKKIRPRNIQGTAMKDGDDDDILKSALSSYLQIMCVAAAPEMFQAKHVIVI
jgi:hypothetical protein